MDSGSVEKQMNQPACFPMSTRANKYGDVTAHDTEEIFQQIYDSGVDPTQTQLSDPPTTSQIDLV